jgi:hypothetical protein
MSPWDPGCAPARGHIRDELITPTGVGATAKCPYPLRRMEMTEPATGDPVVFLTNHFGTSVPG